MTNEKSARIAALNDSLRQSGFGGRTLITRGLLALGVTFVERITTAVRSFDAFSENNDPYGEHDFGALDVGGQRIFFKIDYYSPDLRSGADDPSDPQACVRVLTIMLAEEY